MVTQPLFLAVSTFNCGSEIPAFERWLSPVSGFFEKIVIVDDGSSDDTILHLQGLKRRVKNLSVILRKRNSGRPSLPRNDALRALPTNGRVVFLDVDDRLPYSYLEMLKSTTNGKIYSGVKYACKTVEFDPNVNCNFSSGRLVQEKHLRFKNHITFSGSSLPLETAKSYEFINEPLEDWVYWQQISADGHTIFRLTGVPIGFNSDMGLSPKKLTQVKRVWKRIRLGIIRYFLGTFHMKLEEVYLKLELKNTYVGKLSRLLKNIGLKRKRSNTL